MTFHPEGTGKEFRCRVCGRTIPVQTTTILQFNLTDSLCLSCLEWACSSIQKLLKKINSKKN